MLLPEISIFCKHVSSFGFILTSFFFFFFWASDKIADFWLFSIFPSEFPICCSSFLVNYLSGEMPKHLGTITIIPYLEYKTALELYRSWGGERLRDLKSLTNIIKSEESFLPRVSVVTFNHLPHLLGKVGNINTMVKHVGTIISNVLVMSFATGSM